MKRTSSNYNLDVTETHIKLCMKIYDLLDGDNLTVGELGTLVKDLAKRPHGYESFATTTDRVKVLVNVIKDPLRNSRHDTLESRLDSIVFNRLLKEALK